MFKTIAAVFSYVFVSFTFAQSAGSGAYADDVNAWRTRAETSLKRDTGWLTLAGRWELKPGVNKIGTAKDNDIVFPANVSPAHFGAVIVENGKATLKLNDGLTVRTEREGGEAIGEYTFASDPAKMKWLHRERLALTAFKHPAGKMILRIADQENDVRKNFAGRIWYDVNPAMLVDAKFTPAKTGQKQKIVNVLGEITDETVAGRLEFTLNGRKLALDALGDEKDKDLFVIFNDASASADGKGTYPAGRFLVVARPQGNAAKIDFNRAYNPPCAFSAFTSCPLPPEQNQLKVKVEAGEKFRG
jgi:uncharacterized protein